MTAPDHAAERENEALRAEVARLEGHTMGYLEERDDLREKLSAALARAEKAEKDVAELRADNDTLLTGINNAEGAVDELLARVRALEEGLRGAISAFDRIADEIDDDAGGVDWSDEVRAEATELRALLTPPSPETTDGKEATKS